MTYKNPHYSALVETYGDKVLSDCDVIEYQYPDGSGTWVQCDPDITTRAAIHYLSRGCAVWVNLEPFS